MASRGDCLKKCNLNSMKSMSGTVPDAERAAAIWSAPQDIGSLCEKAPSAEVVMTNSTTKTLPRGARMRYDSTGLSTGNTRCWDSTVPGVSTLLLNQ
ncbi:unnamed protein product [Nippostrongylus brasiliensis]|uniref:Uncharacterized protein n=1 Tax=Nippostrongylus brasiliensis TaxID=27835 RepID=A0A0N4Y2H8_NIPBR|nr:unnamed protein product [Nippostrongylus brasiliensis]